MEVLLDTHTLIWYLFGDEKLSLNSKNIIENDANRKLVSIVSVWEIAIKISIKKFEFSKGLRFLVEAIENNNFEILPIKIEHTITVASLPFHHRDPFDRILIAQCEAENLTIATKDEHFKLYDVKTVW